MMKTMDHSLLAVVSLEGWEVIRTTCTRETIPETDMMIITTEVITEDQLDLLEQLQMKWIWTGIEDHTDFEVDITTIKWTTMFMLLDLDHP